MKDVQPYWELHVTLEADPQKHGHLKAAIEKLNWKFSAIDGDPILGPGVKCYATTHLNKRLALEHATALVQHCGAALAGEGWKVTRVKVESVDFDRRY